MPDGFKIPGTDTTVPYWMIGAAALAGLGAFILSKKQAEPVNTATPDLTGLQSAELAQQFQTFREELMNYIQSNYATQTGQLTGGTSITGSSAPDSTLNPLGTGINTFPPPLGYPTGPDTTPTPPAPVPGNSGIGGNSLSAPYAVAYPGSSYPGGSGGPGAGSGARVLHSMPGIRPAPALFGFPDVAFLTSPINPGFMHTPPVVKSTGLQPATGSFIGGEPGKVLLPFHSSEV